MMVGPMKKKIMLTGVLAFIIPVIIAVVIFCIYRSNVNKEMEYWKSRAAETGVYVFSGDLPINHIITSKDIRIVNAKSDSVSSNTYYHVAGSKAFYSGDKTMIGRKLKIPVQNQTMVMESMFFQEEDSVNDDIRAKEFNMITLPSDLQVGDFIDIRMLFPTGEDYLVVAGEEIMQLGSTSDSNTVFLDLDEEELVKLSGAIIETYIADSIKLYAVKYVNPYQQLFDEVPVDYVEKYENAVVALQEKYTTIEEKEIPGGREPKRGESGEIIPGEFEYTEPTIEEVKKVPTVEELDIKEIAQTAGLKEEDAKAIQVALKENDETLLGLYRNKTEILETRLTENYPIRKEIAKLIASNPNIIESIKAKYQIEELEKERQDLIDTSIYEYDEEKGEMVEKDGALSSIASNLSEEINAQKAERRQYLQTMIRNSMTGM